MNDAAVFLGNIGHLRATAFQDGEALSCCRSHIVIMAQ
jgi:hypothetical protein